MWRNVNAVRSSGVKLCMADSRKAPISRLNKTCSGPGVRSGSCTASASESESVTNRQFRSALRVIAIECATNGDPVDPGAEVGACLEPFQLPIPAHERILHHFFGIGLVAGDAICHAENAAAMLRDQRCVGVFVSGENRLDRGLVALPHAPN